MKSKSIPKEVLDWVKSHCGSRTPAHSKGSFKRFSESTTSACWGQPSGGISVGEYKVAVLQPAPLKVGDVPYFYFDYELANS